MSSRTSTPEGLRELNRDRNANRRHHKKIIKRREEMLRASCRSRRETNLTRMNEGRGCKGGGKRGAADDGFGSDDEG